MVQQIKLSDANGEKVEALSRRTGKSPDVIVNEAVERLVPDVQTVQGASDWRQGWRQAAGMWKDRDDLPELMQQLRREMDRVEPPGESLE
jgi:predicted DNA-binding protein